MRLKERIPNFIEKVNIENLLLNIWELPVSKETIESIKKDLPRIQQLWTEYPDERFSQTLVNNNYIPNYQGFWYYMEESEILKEQGVDASEYLFWGQNYDEKGERLPETRYRLIKELDTDHIKAILNERHTEKGSEYHKALTKELEKRCI